MIKKAKLELIRGAFDLSVFLFDRDHFLKLMGCRTHPSGLRPANGDRFQREEQRFLRLSRGGDEMQLNMGV